MTQRPSSLSRLAFLVIPATLLTGCFEQPPPPPRVSTAVTVQTTRSDDVAQTVRIAGAMEARSSTSLGFRVGGRVVARAVDVGDRVRAGQELARLDPQILDADAASAQAGLAAAEAQIRQASADFERQETLLARGFTTRRDHEAALEALRRAQASREALRAQLSMARDQAAQTILVAPADGVISDRQIEVGQVLAAAQTAFTLVSEGPMDAVFDAPEEALRMALMGASVKISLLDDPSATADGRIRQVAPGVDAKGAVQVKVGVEKPLPAMKPGAPVVGEMKLEPHPFIILPSTALYSDGGSPAVWIAAGDSTVSLRRVEVERYETGRFAIRGGIAPGERVVTAGGQFLRSGQKVEIMSGGGS
ncbi:efflux RND transporter periplasmic adaptor subunit [Neomegalonema sp.]|uniref:efflux RND transporter periplasmic adaptor subunit n=1 Tax=Neomegalonema sp. TaxID=2039713 RepID=UPI00261258CF|nr:efflux RND transporter periplasmic adaptor subunit [Neomegalonema sp.]MDD2869219.1 efflux RND transporter periplasmic adaptor subunit [Neomegalonema sp.]